MSEYKVETYLTRAGLKKEADLLENENFQKYLNSKEEEGWSFVSCAFLRNNGGEVTYKVFFKKEK